MQSKSDKKYKESEKGKEAHRRASRAYYHRNRERCLENSRRYAAKDPEAYSQKRRERTKKFQQTPKGIYKIIQRNSGKRGRVFSLPRIDFIRWYEEKAKFCYYCGISEEKLARRLEIERKDNEVGYIFENMELACKVCNSTKGKYLTESEMKIIAEVVIKKRYVQ